MYLFSRPLIWGYRGHSNNSRLTVNYTLKAVPLDSACLNTFKLVLRWRRFQRANQGNSLFAHLIGLQIEAIFLRLILIARRKHDQSLFDVRILREGEKKSSKRRLFFWIGWLANSDWRWWSGAQMLSWFSVSERRRERAQHMVSAAMTAVQWSSALRIKWN